MTSSTEHCQRRIDPDVTVADDGKLPLPGRPNSFQRWLMKHLLQRLLRDSQHCSRTYREAFDNAVRAVRFVTAPLDSASGTCTPKFAQVCPSSNSVGQLLERENLGQMRRTHTLQACPC